MLQYIQCTVLVFLNFQSGIVKKNKLGQCYVVEYRVVLNIINDKYIAFNSMQNLNENLKKELTLCNGDGGNVIS